MKIHLLSDLHLESGPYALAPELACDVIVAAGDIGVDIQGIEWLKTLDKPVVYVLGNHEYWRPKNDPIDMDEVIDRIREAAFGSNVHVLENESIVIGNIHFLGATLWTDLGKFHPSLINEAQRLMNDYRTIYCPNFYANQHNLAQFYALANDFSRDCGKDNPNYIEYLQQHFVEPGRFHPIVSYLLHQESVAWINTQLKHCDTRHGGDKKTVVVTHHHPSYESLRRIGINDGWPMLGEEMRSNGLNPSDHLYKVACYASDVSIHHNGHQVSAWMCGHLHHHLDYLQHGMRIISNARGRYSGPITEEQARVVSFFGMHVSAEDIENSRQLFIKNPYRGNGIEFDPRCIVDIED